eukprot:6778187-Pyramimonas_sp.AAC.1
MKYIGDKQKAYQHWDHYKYCKNFKNKMLALGIYNDFKAFVESHCELLDKRVGPIRMARACYDCCMMLNGDAFNGSVNSAISNLALLELL